MATAKDRQAVPVVTHTNLDSAGHRTEIVRMPDGEIVERCAHEPQPHRATELERLQVAPRTSPIAKLYKLHRAAETAKLLRAALIDLLDHEGAEAAQMKLDEIERRITEHTAHTKAPTVVP